MKEDLPRRTGLPPGGALIVDFNETYGGSPAVAVSPLGRVEPHCVMVEPKKPTRDLVCEHCCHPAPEPLLAPCATVERARSPRPVSLDFNRAYRPLCASSHDFDCPLQPSHHQMWPYLPVKRNGFAPGGPVEFP